jgi:serine/threonine protein kinase
LHNIIHRDIKPENILTCPSNPAHVRLIDFGIARHLGTDMITAPKKLYNPVEDNRPIIGSLQWCSLNAHSGYGRHNILSVHSPLTIRADLRPQDDIESLAYTLFFLVLGNVPWRRTGAYVHESPRNAMARIDAAKRAFGGALPVSGSPTEFSDLLQVARIPTTRLVPSLASTRQMLDNLASRLGIQRGAPLDWTPIAVTTQMPDHSRIDPISSTAPNRLVIEDGVVNSPYSNSYYGWDISDWDNIRYERSLSATFPSHDAELLDGQIPELGRILDEE